MTVRTSGERQQLTVDLTASVDLTAKTVRVAMKQPVEMEVVQVGRDMFAHMTYLKDEPLVRLQVSKLRPTSTLRDATDVARHVGILGGVVTAEQRDAGRYAGVADLGLAAQNASGTARSQLAALGRVARNASAMPYEATLDAQGRLTALSYTAETATGALRTEIELTGLGEPVRIKRPARAEDATDWYYERF
ncbi:hypothetical protein [Asanoa siamensis]|uniref:Uncharacterized protein n=1 Tax=Asanoa siamensis TaxID=926357 RepID=A0ABQ4CXN0_9ACTN|nr:hypothetical protein [Asanoa siamensis]GIF76051.1 hypothetical protein Asi02nite_55690 [Asanoa siamensis]